MNDIVLATGSSVFVKLKCSWIWIYKIMLLCRWLIAFPWVWQLPSFSIMLYVKSDKLTVFMNKLKQLNILNLSIVQNPGRQKHLSSLILESTALMASRQMVTFYATSVFSSRAQSSYMAICHCTPPHQYSSLMRVLHSHWYVQGAASFYEHE